MIAPFLILLAMVNTAWSWKLASPSLQTEITMFLMNSVGIKEQLSAEAYATHLISHGLDSVAALRAGLVELPAEFNTWKPAHQAAFQAWRGQFEAAPQLGLQPIPAYRDEPPQVCLRFLCPMCSIYYFEGCSGSCLVAFILGGLGWIPSSLYAVLMWVPRGHSKSGMHELRQAATSAM
jgi:uncharacterized membrane protein YqaE (UPF0057 family)